MAQEKSAYAQYCAKNGVTAVGVYVDTELVDMTKAAAKAADVKHSQWIRATFIEAVNNAGLQHEDGSEWTFVEKTKESLQDENARLKAEIEAMRAQMVPTPPTQIADAKTGEVKEKAA